MLKYIRILFYFLSPGHNKAISLYYDDLAYVVNYIQSLNIGDKVKFHNFLKNVSSVIVVGKFDACALYKIAFYKKWDLKREFLPTDTAWLLVDGDNRLRLISFNEVKVKLSIEQALNNFPTTE